MTWRSSIAIRALASYAEDPLFETHFERRVGHLPTVHPAANGGNTGGDKGGEERNWSPYLTMPMAQDKSPP